MLVSVVIPTHNRSDLLVRAVNSVLNQTYQTFEIIIVSDGSTDDTEDVIKELEKQDSRIKSEVYYPSRGGNVARNIGSKLANGDYVAFLDDDDEWYEDKLMAQLNVFNTDTAIGLVYTGIEVIYVNEKTTYISKGNDSGDLSKKILFGNCIGSTSSAIVKKTLLEEVNYFDENMPAMQDYDLWIRICQKSLIGVVRDEKVKYYNYTNKEQVSLNTAKYEAAKSAINEKYQDLFKQLTELELQKIRIRTYLNLAERCFRNNEKSAALNYIKKALKERPNIKSVLYMFLLPIPYSTILKIRSYKK